MNPLAEPLCFEKPLLMLGGAPIPMHQLERELGRGLPLIAVDGGANHLLGSNIYPEAIVGDMDSLQHRDNWAKRSRLLSLQEQDSTDFEKCLYSARAPSYIALGFASARLDHTLACLHAMAKRVHTHRVVLLGDVDVMVVCSGPFEAALPLGLRLSVFPLTPVQFVRSRGLQYPLHNLRLAVGECVGTSNCVNAPRVCIEPRANDPGVYAVIAPLEAQAQFETWAHGSD